MEPNVNVTFLFTDIEGSTLLAQNQPGKLPAALEIHNSILRNTFESNKGFVFKIIGDAFCCAFENAENAVQAGVEAQLNLASHNWDGAEIKIRIGIHTGEAEWDGSNYHGYMTLARTARIMSSAYGGQIIISNETYISSLEKLPEYISFRDLGERRLKDLKKPIRLFQVLSKNLREEFPPLKTLDARPNNLPVQNTSFIGRQKEISAIKELVKKNSLLTILGPGGAGKTRLALQVAADLIDDFGNGVWFADVSPVTEDKMLVRSASKVFGIIEDPGKSLEISLLEYLQDKELLLIIDNCEQIINSVSELTVKILSGCRNVKIITSSRESLRIPGEQIFYVSSMKNPDTKIDLNAEEIMNYESVKLFVERAKAVKHDFKVTDKNAGVLRDICIQLDGIPLAIELAASRVNTFSLEMIKDRLNDRFRFLNAGVRTALPRQQTLRALVDWSYDLLLINEKLLLNRISVFSNGWTLEAAEEVCSDERLNKFEIIDLLSKLIEKSLITSCVEDGRFRILETIREYGEQMLVESGELENVLLKHLDHYITFAEKARKEIEGADQKEWLDKLEFENFNFRTAITTSIVRELKEKGLYLAITLSRFWESRGYISEAMSYIEELILDPEEFSQDIRRKAFQWMGTFNWIKGNYEKAQSFYEKSFKINELLNDKKGLGVSHTNLGIIEYAKGEFEKAKYHGEESFKLFNELGDDHLAADCLLNLGAPLVNLGEYEYAEKVFTESLNLYRKLQDSRGKAMALNNLGKLAEHNSDYETARIYLEESLYILRDIKEKRGIIEILNNLSACYSYLGFKAKAEEYLCESLEINAEMGNKKVLADSKNMLGFIKFDSGESQVALNLHLESLNIRIDLNNKFGIYNSLIGISQAISEKYPVKAAKILGFTEEAFYSFENEPLEILKIEIDKTKKYLNQKLGAKEFLTEMESGKKISLEEVTELAMNLNF